MNITYDFIFQRTPCTILTVDTVDILGNHRMTLDKETKKERLEAKTMASIGIYQKVFVV